MIERLGDLKARIERWIKERRSDDKPLYEFVTPPNSVIVREVNEAGEAHIDVSYPEGAHCVVWHLESTGYFLFLKGERTADGAFFVCQSDGRVDVHIIECKRTLTASSWGDAKRQIQDSMSKILAITGVLGMEISNVCLGAAFRENRIDQSESLNPRLGPVPLRGDQEGANSEMTARARELAEWRTGQVHLRGFAKPFSLAKIQLDPETGRGGYAPPNP